MDMSLDIGWKQTTTRVFVMLAAVTVPTPALAAGYDIKAYCKNVANVSGGSYAIEESCRQMEADARLRVEARRAGVPKRVMAYCDRVAVIGGGGSYAMLDSCIDMELQAKRNMGE